MKHLILLMVLLVSVASEAEDLLGGYKSISEHYLFQLAHRCLNEHVINESNAINPKTLLPIKDIIGLYYSSPFTLDTEFIGFHSQEGVLDKGAGMRCAFKRQTGEILAFSSINSEMSDENHYSDSYSETIRGSKFIYKYSLNEEDILFGLRYNYGEFIARVKKLSEKN